MPGDHHPDTAASRLVAADRRVVVDGVAAFHLTGVRNVPDPPYRPGVHPAPHHPTGSHFSSLESKGLYRSQGYSLLSVNRSANRYEPLRLLEHGTVGADCWKVWNRVL